MTDGPKVGDKAPAFDLPTDDGQVSMAGLKGKTVVLYFYPKDDTTGCTNEAKAFTASAADFAKAGAVVVGVSKDTPAKHGKFKAKYGLKVVLGSDESGEMIERYGVWVEKTLYGRNYMGIERATFLIDGAGVIRRVWRKVKVAGHAEDVLAGARSLSA
ncbi:peroxiredoxin [soil metagenome]